MQTLVMILLVAAVVGFIAGLRLMSRTHTARLGNLISAGGMAAAIIGTLLQLQVIGILSPTALAWSLGAIGLGTLIGIPAAMLVKMTAMPEMVALFNGFGGIASLFIASGEIHHAGAEIGAFTASAAFLAMLIGGITFTGSLVAFSKLAEKIPSGAVLFKGQQVLNALLVLAVVIGLVVFAAMPELAWIFWVAIAAAAILGVLAVIPIGGADMPVVISLLNSYSGLAACAAGFAINSPLLITIGALVGAAGIILTRVMCKAMNRSLANVLFSGFGTTTASSGSGGPQGEAKALSTQDAYYVLEAASSVVFIPGYGMAVAQAQHAVRELADTLAARGCEVKFAIHPVAGRMPGHMNVLLAEANVSYDLLVEMDDINPTMGSVDVAVVIGANDTVNPAAVEDPKSAIAGMPIIMAHQARQVFVLKRSMRSGFAGIENPLFFRDNTSMIFGDAKATIEALNGEFKEG
ncbi:MAG: NAD(P)(+) transhydrogenase (Re/Si-specific) subunit beta [Planctomycetota bacterium]|nr:MAG: NAD(P)(+) transhydrogenase (Re/Si-specific) subunit beta [Planctomycetota bacterium]